MTGRCPAVSGVGARPIPPTAVAWSLRIPGNIGVHSEHCTSHQIRRTNMNEISEMIGTDGLLSDSDLDGVAGGGWKDRAITYLVSTAAGLTVLAVKYIVDAVTEP